MATPANSAPKSNAEDAAAKERRSASAPSETRSQKLFLGLLKDVIVEEPILHAFDGSICRTHANIFWRFVCRDLITDLDERIEAAIEGGEAPEAALDALLPEVVAATRGTLNGAGRDDEANRRLTVQLGGDEVRERLPVILTAIRCRTLIKKAQAFGRAANALPDEATVGRALKNLPLKEPAVAALVLNAVVGQVSNPSRLVAGIIPNCGGASEDLIRSGGYGLLIEALLAHAQCQYSRLSDNSGTFADVDLICRSVDRFHRLIRAISGYVELHRSSRWSRLLSELIMAVTNRIEPRLREVSSDVSQALRRPREGNDRIDPDRVLAALNGLYLLAAVRDARDSLALNALFDKLWAETGQALETLLPRNLDDYRNNPGSEIAAQRVDAGLKMAEIRFNAEYAEILRRARDAVGRRSGLAG